ncbi:MAG: hypothetical protein J6A92_01690 [Lachnospiraceae bacterium]|nr:hypothetical protein [Lachnospiraceae bacterium]
MFGGKKIKEAEEKIQELERIQGEYQTFSEEVQKTKPVVEEFLAAVSDDTELVKQEIEAVKETLATEKQSTKELKQQMSEANESLSDILNRQNQLYQKQKEEKTQREQKKEDSRQQQQLMQEINELCGKAKEEETQLLDSRKEAVDCSIEIVAKLLASAGEMSVLALTAGIEAGRLGGAGKDFLEAAEGVRKLAEEYSSMLNTLNEQIKVLDRPETSTNTLDVLKVKTERAAKIEEFLTEEEDKESQIKALCDDLQTQMDMQQEIMKKITVSEEGLDNVTERLCTIQEKERKTQKAKEAAEKQLMPVYKK